MAADLSEEKLRRGTQLLISHLETMIEDDPELADFHAAFEAYCANKYSLGSFASTYRLGGPKDQGIDFYSRGDRSYNVGQCKIPARDWLEANPGEIKLFGPQAVDDPRDALRYLVGDSKETPSERVRQLHAEIAADKNQDDFALTFFFVVYGKLNNRASNAFKGLKDEYQSSGINIILQDIEALADDFLIGADRPATEVNLELQVPDQSVLHGRGYCYFLANAADLLRAFIQYGWRLFDLNVRYEIRNSPINGDIVKSLAHQKTRRSFHHYNNGLIVVTKNYVIRDKDARVRLNGAQIVNGLQTVKSIYNAVKMKEVSVEQLEKDCVVQVKAIQAADPEFISGLVRATNNQNPMAARNLRANTFEQRSLRTAFAHLKPRWFLQVKEGEWESLNEGAGKFFKEVTGFPASDFRPEPTRRKGRVVDNQDLGKAWLSAIGFADLAGDRVTHYFTEDSLYELIFTKRPTISHWQRFAEVFDFDAGRQDGLEAGQPSASQYLLSYVLWQFARAFIPASQRARETALQEGVVAGKIEKRDGSIVSSEAVQDAYLSDNATYQTWRLMSNMKELLVECAAQILARKYGSLEENVASEIVSAFDVHDFLDTGDLRDIAQTAASANDLPADAVLSRIFGLLRHASTQYWEERRKTLLSTSRIRTALLRRSVASDFKAKVWEINDRKSLDKPWKPEGKTFIDSLPKLRTKGVAGASSK